MSEAAIYAPERGANRTSDEQGRPFDPKRVSPSRVNAYLFCGESFKRRYIDREPPTMSGSAALFGSVCHTALEKWALNRSTDLVTLTAQAWIHETAGTPVADFLKEYQLISIECMRAEAYARVEWEKKNPGKKSQAPRMTKIFKDSEAAKKLAILLARWIPKLNAESPWRFSERDPLPSLYDESLILAKRYAAKWNSLPPALYTEFGFTVPWEGFILRGFIDSIEPVLNLDKVIAYAIVDYKSYRADPAGAKDHRQAVVYDVSFEYLCREGLLPFDPDLPRYVVFDYLRLLRRTDYEITSLDRGILKRDLDMYYRGVSGGVFLPAHKNQNPDFCDYPENCCLRTRGDTVNKRGSLYPDETEE